MQDRSELKASQLKNRGEGYGRRTKSVFVRAVKGAEVGKHGTVRKVVENTVVIDCTVQERLAPVLAQMWDVLPERLYGRLLKRRTAGSPMRNFNAT